MTDSISFLRTVPAIRRTEKRFAPAGSSIADIAAGHLGNGDAIDAFIRNPDGTTTRVPAAMWARVKPKRSGVVEFHARMRGGGSRQILALVAAVALAVIAPVIAGTLFAAGTVGFALTSAAITIGGSYLLSKLFASEQEQLALSEQGQKRGDPADVSTDSNLLAKGAVLPHVWGGYRKVLLPDVIQPHTYMDNGIEAIEKMLGAWRGHAHRNIRVSDVPVEDHDSITVEVKSGRANAGITTMIDRFTKTVSINAQLSQFRSDEDGVLEDQVHPVNASPIWHHFTTPDLADLDQISIRFSLRSLVKSDAPDVPVAVPIRGQYRLIGESTWKNLPEIEISAADSGELTREFLFRWDDDFPISPNGSAVSWRLWAEVPATSDTLASGATGVQWEADSYFNGGGGASDVVNVQKRQVGLYFRMTEAVMPKGKIEFRFRRGIGYSASSLSSGYALSGTIRSLFEARDNSGDWVLPVAQAAYPGEVSAILATSLSNNLPVTQPNTFLIALRSRGQGFRGVSAELAGDALDWSGTAWETLNQSDNPATQCRYLCELAEQHFRTGKHSRFARIRALNQSIVDDEWFVAWRAQCIKSGAKVSYITNGQSLAEAMQRIMAAGFAQPSYGIKIGGFFLRDSSTEDMVLTFSPRNGTNISARYTTPPMPAATRVTFNDASDDWEENEITVQSVVPVTERRQESVSVEAQDDADLVRQRMEFDQLRRHHWRTTWTVQTEIEGVTVKPGDIVGLVTDLVTDRAHGARVRSVTSASVIRIDQTIEPTATDASLSAVTDDWSDFFETGEQSYIAVYSASGMEIRQIIEADQDESGMDIRLDSPLSTTDIVGAHVTIGSLSEQIRRMIVVEVSPSGEFGTVLTLADERPEIYQYFKDNWGWTS